MGNNNPIAEDYGMVELGHKVRIFAQDNWRCGLQCLHLNNSSQNNYTKLALHFDIFIDMNIKMWFLPDHDTSKGWPNTLIKQ